MLSKGANVPKCKRREQLRAGHERDNSDKDHKQCLGLCLSDQVVSGMGTPGSQRKPLTFPIPWQKGLLKMRLRHPVLRKCPNNRIWLACGVKTEAAPELANSQSGQERLLLWPDAIIWYRWRLPKTPMSLSSRHLGLSPWSLTVWSSSHSWTRGSHFLAPYIFLTMGPLSSSAGTWDPR